MRALILIALVLAGCPYGYTIPKDPEPIAALNTAYDDYNAAPPPALHEFVWSTNRGSQGAHFDLWIASGTFFDSGFEYQTLPREEWPRPLAPLASTGDEFGPCYEPDRWRGSEVESYDRPCPLVFASDRPGGQGGLDLYRFDETIRPLPHVNSPANEAYWSAFGASGKGPRAAYFASDRGGSGFDIYELSNDGTIRAVDALNSGGDDSAPFVLLYGGEPCMLFASNREGGRGGWDLYRARYVEGSWQRPKNLGRRYNTSHNEFRPCAAGAMLVFSSDRPGGKGGYDLYRARLPDLR